MYSREDLVGSSAATATSSPPENQAPATTEEATAAPTENVITPTPTENPFATLYDCDMKLEFVSGPLESKTTEFKVLGQDYFVEKEDKFDPGKGTSIYYQFQHYFILHSSYVNGNVLRPMEAEFIRKYLEYWGESGSQYIQGQIESLIGTEVNWVCDGQVIFNTKIDGITRLSHEASQDLWVNPDSLVQILMNKEGIESEWIGGMLPTTEPHLYVAFCGWGPASLDAGRYTYFRYVLRFIIQ
ncbi:hypothetical protein JR338_03800 [Chloroflexota bacterium]|nr:hypothetical protein JR338_03800 [Chloroflexota bacterium]